MTRRSLALLLIAAGVILAGAVLVLWLRGPERVHGRSLPRGARSLLLITVDTTRPDHLEPYGAVDVETPNLSALARDGIVFERAYAVAPITLVAHTSILTGLYPPRHGVRNNGIHHASEDLETLAERLGDEGFRTGAFVSAAVLERRYGLDQGFEVYDDDLSTGSERHPRMVPDRPAAAVVDSATRWLETVGPDERFFAWVHFYDPHAAYSPPPPFRDTYRERLYDGEIAYMDQEIGRLLAHPRLAQDDDLAVMVVGDHGESLGEHGEQTHAILAYDATLHVPLILRLPGGPRARRVPEPVSQTDLVPTSLNLLGIRPAEDLDGLSLLPLIAGTGEARAPRPIYSETFLPFYTYGWSKLEVLREGDFKLIDAPEQELYDTRRDPRELSDLCEDRPNQVHDLNRALEALLEKAGGGDREAGMSIDQESAEKLRSLGYLAVGSGPAGPEAERPNPRDVIDLHVGLERARQLASNQLFEQAIAQLRGVLDQDPGNMAALLDLALNLQELGQLEEAVDITAQVMTLDPEYLRPRLIMASLELERGNLEQALSLVDSVLEADPNYIEALVRKGLILRRLGRPAEAEGVLDAGLAAHPDDPQLLVANAAHVLMPREDLESAEVFLRRALDRDPFMAHGWRLLGEVLDRQGRFDEAATAYRNGLRGQPDSPELHASLGLLLARLGGGPEAEAHLREAIRLGRTFRSELHVSLGALLAESGRFQEAETQYELVLSRDPANPSARNNKAIALYRTGRTEEAEEVLRRLLADHPRYADAHNNLAAVALDRRDWAAAERHARATLDLKPEFVEAWNNLGIAQDEQGRLEEALASFEKALELQPEYWQAKVNLGITLRKMGRWADAARTLQETLPQRPNDPDVHLELAELYAGPLAEPGRARDHFNAFLRFAPRDPRAAEARTKLSALPPG